MKLIRLFLALLGILSCSLFAEEGVADLPIGAPAPDFALAGIDGKTHRLADFKDGKVLMVFFTSNHCPTSHGVEGRLKQFLKDFRDKGLSFVAINPNNPDGVSIEELGYSKYNDGFEDMKKYAADCGFDFPYLYDGETQTTAKAYGCLATPHVFVFDSDRKLRYKGWFDDSRYADPATVKSSDARNAVAALLEGKPVPVEITKPHGCSTKWKSKQTTITERIAKWDKTPVDVEKIDVAGVEGLLKGSKNVRIFNVWATWCGPCVAEFPDLVSVSRQFALRNFELITVSMDDPNDIAKAKAFLERRGAGLSDRLKKSVKEEGRTTNSYLFTGANQAELMKVLDPEWKGGIPHTVLVGTNGKVVWRHSGAVTADELRARILEHMGPHYTP